MGSTDGSCLAIIRPKSENTFRSRTGGFDFEYNR